MDGLTITKDKNLTQAGQAYTEALDTFQGELLSSLSRNENLTGTNGTLETIKSINDALANPELNDDVRYETLVVLAALNDQINFYSQEAANNLNDPAYAEYNRAEAMKSNVLLAEVFEQLTVSPKRKPETVISTINDVINSLYDNPEDQSKNPMKLSLTTNEIIRKLSELQSKAEPSRDEQHIKEAQDNPFAEPTDKPSPLLAAAAAAAPVVPAAAPVALTEIEELDAATPTQPTAPAPAPTSFSAKRVTYNVPGGGMFKPLEQYIPADVSRGTTGFAKTPIIPSLPVTPTAQPAAPVAPAAFDASEIKIPPTPSERAIAAFEEQIAANKKSLLENKGVTRAARVLAYQKFNKALAELERTKDQKKINALREKYKEDPRLSLETDPFTGKPVVNNAPAAPQATMIGDRKVAAPEVASPAPSDRPVARKVAAPEVARPTPSDRPVARKMAGKTVRETTLTDKQKADIQAIFSSLPKTNIPDANAPQKGSKLRNAMAGFGIGKVTGFTKAVAKSLKERWPTILLTSGFGAAARIAITAGVGSATIASLSAPLAVGLAVGGVALGGAALGTVASITNMKLDALRATNPNMGKFNAAARAFGAAIVATPQSMASSAWKVGGAYKQATNIVREYEQQNGNLGFIKRGLARISVMKAIDEQTTKVAIGSVIGAFGAGSGWAAASLITEDAINQITNEVGTAATTLVEGATSLLPSQESINTLLKDFTSAIGLAEAPVATPPAPELQPPTLETPPPPAPAAAAPVPPTPAPVPPPPAPAPAAAAPVPPTPAPAPVAAAPGRGGAGAVHSGVSRTTGSTVVTQPPSAAPLPPNGITYNAQTGEYFDSNGQRVPNSGIVSSPSERAAAAARTPAQAPRVPSVTREDLLPAARQTMPIPNPTQEINNVTGEVRTLPPIASPAPSQTASGTIRMPDGTMAVGIPARTGIYMDVQRILGDNTSSTVRAAIENDPNAARLVNALIQDRLRTGNLPEADRRVLTEALRDLAPQRPAAPSVPRR